MWSSEHPCWAFRHARPVNVERVGLQHPCVFISSVGHNVVRQFIIAKSEAVIGRPKNKWITSRLD
jgi:hypothetical protein